MSKNIKKSRRYRRRLFEQKVSGFIITAITALIGVLFYLIPFMPKDCTFLIIPAIMGVYMMVTPKIIADELNNYD